MTTPKQPRERGTGTLTSFVTAEGTRAYRGRIRLADGSRPWLRVPDEFAYSEARAGEWIAFMQEQERAKGKLLAAKKSKATPTTLGGPETSDAWHERFTVFRRTEVESADEDRWRWRKWCSPHIGAKAIVDVDADDIENIRDALNAAVLAYEAAGNDKGEGRLSPKSAKHAWSALVTAFKYASTRKGPRELRVREAQGNPCLGIPPPRDGASKRRQWLRPGEVLAVVSSPVVPREWREAIAIGTYLHLRPGELHELRVRDLDLASGEVRICRAYDERKKRVKAPKTEEGVRTVTIPATLAPLLERVATERDAETLVAPVVAATDEYYRAGLFRSFLRAAGVSRAELFAETATHLAIDFRSIRDTGITHRFLRGDRAEVVQRESGHEQIATTLAYAKEVHARGGRYGEPFPALPADLLAPEWTDSDGPSVQIPVYATAKPSESKWAHRDLNPGPTD